MSARAPMGATSKPPAICGFSGRILGCKLRTRGLLLQNTALRGIIESERLDRLDRVRYKNRYLVS